MNQSLLKTASLSGWGLLLLGFGVWVAREVGIRSRAEDARDLIRHLDAAVRIYETDWAVFPPGDGSGSWILVERLGKRTRCKYYSADEPMFAAEELTELHDIRNPLWPDDSIIRYRSPGFHNRGSFDLWTEDPSGRPDGINNWE